LTPPFKASSRAPTVLETTLHRIGTQETDENAPDTPLDSSVWSEILSFLENSVSSFNGAFDDLIINSRNSVPSFVVAQGCAVSGSEHGDWFFLSDEGDTFDGGIGMDVLFGMGGNDSLNGDSENDVIIGGAGNDTINGGEGDEDIAHSEAAVSRFTVQFLSDGSAVVEDRATNGEGTDTVSNIEKLTFETSASIFQNGDFDVLTFNGLATLTEEQISGVIVTEPG